MVQLIHFSTVQTMGNLRPHGLSFPIPHLYMSGDHVSCKFSYCKFSYYNYISI